MKAGENSERNDCLRRGFTILELVLVIAIIILLVGILIPSSTRPREQTISQAKMDVHSIATAIRKYETEYGRYPVSTNVLNTARATQEDFTFGTFGLAGLRMPIGSLAILSPVVTSPSASLQANNAEIMAVLMDVETNANGHGTINYGHKLNPMRTKYFNARPAIGDRPSGLGRDGVFRDPWGNPYIITIDCNGHGHARDAFYRLPTVSALQTNSLLKPISTAAGTVYESSDAVMVWSAGPDGMVDPTKDSSEGANKDNVISWGP